MKLTITKPELSLAMSRVQGALADRTLAVIGIRALGSQIEICSSDRNLAVYTEHPGNILDQGTVFVPAKLFVDVVRELPEGDVQLSASDSFLSITAGDQDSFQMKLPINGNKEWKPAPELVSQNSAKLPCDQLKYMIDQVQFCISPDSPRNYGTVGYLHKPDNDHMRLVSTDGYRLSYCSVELDKPSNFLDEGICISKRGLQEIERMCREGQAEDLELCISEDKTIMLAQLGDYKVYFKLSAVKYPRYEGVLPTANMTPVPISRSHVQNVAKRVLLAADKSRALQMSFSANQLLLSSKTSGTSEGRETISLNEFSGEPKNLSVNGKYLSDVFSTIACDDISLNIRGSEDPVAIIPGVEPRGCKSLHVLVPISEHD